jgi:hypothetical protein
MIVWHLASFFLIGSFSRASLHLMFNHINTSQRLFALAPNYVSVWFIIPCYIQSPFYRPFFLFVRGLSISLCKQLSLYQYYSKRTRDQWGVQTYKENNRKTLCNRTGANFFTTVSAVDKAADNIFSMSDTFQFLISRARILMT